MDSRLTCMYVRSFTFELAAGVSKHDEEVQMGLWDGNWSLRYELGGLREWKLIRTTTQIRDAMGNDYHRPKDVYGENRYAFTSHADSAFDVCFESVITNSTSPFPYFLPS